MSKYWSSATSLGLPLRFRPAGNLELKPATWISNQLSGAPTNSLESIFCQFLFISFIFFHFLSFSFIFFVFFLSFSFSFPGGQNLIFFGPQLPHDFLTKLLCKKSFFWAVSGGTPLGPLFFFCLFITFLYFLSFSFNFFHFLSFSLSFFLPMVVFLHLFLHNPILKMLIAISCRIISKNVMGFLGGWVVCNSPTQRARRTPPLL